MAETKSTQSPWGVKTPMVAEAQVTSFADLMSEELAKDLQSKYLPILFLLNEIKITDMFLVFFFFREESIHQEVGAVATENFDLLIDPEDTMSDEMLAKMLQLQFDQEYDRDLGKVEAKYNGASKGRT